MDAIYISIEKNIKAFELYEKLWAIHGKIGIRADTMTEGIRVAIAVEKSDNQYLYFIDIVADDIDYMPQLAILNGEINAPILIATSQYNDVEHRQALRNGACYYGKYFDEPETNIQQVEAAVECHEREKKKKESSTIIFRGVLISPSHRQAFVNDLEIELTKNEFNLLLLLMSNRGRAFSYEETYNHVWNAKYQENDNVALKAVIKKLRKKISNGNDEIIENLWGFGYKISL